ncbi:MAG TPA: glycosyl hydrolase family 28-related protein [Abditibacteriaceae bacterium]
MRFALLACLLFCLPTLAAEKPQGVRGDGRTDDTLALQKALSALAAKGGTLELPPGQYLLAGNLQIPTSVTLQGSWQAPHHAAYDKGSTLLLTGGRGSENALPAITLQQSAALRGFTLLWPQQKWPNIVSYPWAIQGVGMHNTVENITFVNAYNGIRLGHIADSELHLVRNVYGCVLRRGVFVDSTTDIGRLENVHFNPHYWNRSGHSSRPPQDGNPDLKISGYMTQHLEAFIFGRSDWQSVTSCFVFGAKIGFRFIRTKSGASNAQLSGVGADNCRIPVQIEEIQRLGVQFTNSTFQAAGGPPGTAVVTTVMAGGAAHFLNCTFWEAPGGVAQLDGNTQVNFSDCQFFAGARQGAIRATQGVLTVRGCSFNGEGVAIALKPNVKAAIITGNLQPRGLKVQNEIGTRAQIGLNEIAPHTPSFWRYELWAFTPLLFLIALIFWRHKWLQKRQWQEANKKPTLKT